MSSFHAVRPGTNLSVHVRDLVRLHDAVLSGTPTTLQPRAVVARSWSRMLRSGLDANGDNARDPLPLETVLRLRRESPLSLVIDELIEVVSAVADAASFLMVVTDPNGVILWRCGASAVRRRADLLGFSEGATWTENIVGTNAIGTALAESAPVQLFAAEHFEAKQHPWYCTAAPIHDPRTGSLLGIVDISGPALTLHPAIGALVETAVRLAESRLRHHHQTRLERLRRTAEPVLAALRGPALVVDEDGWVAHQVGLAPRDRIAVPRSATAVAVPGLGVCLPERLTDGWLIRPAGPGRRVTATLDLACGPLLTVHTEAEPWRAVLSARHADLLVLLHRAGPAGRSAEQLSVALYGDGEHKVTVRAEVSRMRRLIGALVATRPYRLADGVSLTVLAAGADRSRLWISGTGQPVSP